MKKEREIQLVDKDEDQSSLTEISTGEV